jgi:hypothetical protein
MMVQLNRLADENKEMTKRYLDLLAEQTKNAAQPAQTPKTFAEQLEERAREQEALDRLRPPRRGSVQQEDQHPVLDLIERIAAPIVEQAAPIIGMKIQQGMMAARQQQQRPAPPRPAGQPPAAAAVAGPQPEQQAQTTEGGSVQVQLPKIVADNIGTALTWFREWADGTAGRSGTDFGDWLAAGATTQEAIPAFRMLGSDQNPPMTPVDFMIALAKGIPVIWGGIERIPEGEAKFREFLTELVMWTPAQPEEPEAEEPPQ